MSGTTCISVSLSCGIRYWVILPLKSNIQVEPKSEQHSPAGSCATGIQFHGEKSEQVSAHQPCDRHDRTSDSGDRNPHARGG